ncbi:MAG: protein sorting system archaetidylserine synthase [Haloarculaceae archaeon]
MRVSPRFVGHLGVADVATVANAALGFAAAAVATVDVHLAARLVLLAAIADGVDGVLARAYGGSEVGPLLDSLADVASFGVAPAVLVFVVASREWGLSLAAPDARLVAALAVPALFVAMGVVRLGLYTVHDSDDAATEGVQTTLAATVLALLVLAGVPDLLGMRTATLLLVVAGVSTYLLVAPITYPDLYTREQLVFGGLQALAVLLPAAVGRVFPRALLLFALAYLLLAPRFYWRTG